MAGRPRRQAMIAALLRRTAEECDDVPDASPLDYVERWISAGNTLKDLGIDLARHTRPKDLEETDLSWTISGDMISRYLESLHGEQPTVERLSRARVRASYSMVDEALSLADEAKSEDAAATRLRVQSRQWTAERFNPGTFGSKKDVNVSISVSALHLDALRTVQREVTGSIQGVVHNTTVANTPNAEVVAITSVSGASE